MAVRTGPGAKMTLFRSLRICFKTAWPMSGWARSRWPMT